jgi:SAM-dependent methyltransferase
MTFGSGVEGPTPQHVRWYRRMAPLFSLPRGSSILDYGGGYGIDAIFLAALGYDVLLYEVTPNQLAIARAFQERFAEREGKLAIRYVHAGHDEMPRDLDAVMLKEAAHHIEPVQPAFDNAAAMLRRGGYLYLLEPNFLNPGIQATFFRVRGFKTVERRVDDETGQKFLVGNEHIRTVAAWTRHARAAGLAPQAIEYYIPWPGKAPRPSSWQRALDRVPVNRHLLGSHVTMTFTKL